MSAAGLVVVGSGPAGVGAAEAFRKHNSGLPVTIVTDDRDPPYARPPLSKEFLRGDSQDVALHEADWFTERDIELLLSDPVNSIDPAARTVTLGTSRLRYEALVLACGSRPTPLPVPGGKEALQLRSLADAARLRAVSTQATSAVVIGAGFIGCEAAASLAMRGVQTTLVAPEAAPQTERLGVEAAHRILGLLDEIGVRYVGEVSVRGISGTTVHLENDATLETDLILAATGVTPRSELGADAGLTTERDRIVAGADMRASIDGIFAAGDVALTFNSTARRPLAVEHWQDATDQGSVAGATAAGEIAEWDGVPGFWTTIGDATLKYHAWGDGYEHSRLVESGDGFTVWYESGGVAVGVLTYNADSDYDLGERLIAERKPTPVAIKPATNGD